MSEGGGHFNVINSLYVSEHSEHLAFWWGKIHYFHGGGVPPAPLNLTKIPHKSFF